MTPPGFERRRGRCHVIERRTRKSCVWHIFN
jgi:hypothetical protein